MPNDVFSADPNQEDCYRLRRRLGGDDWAWMGDVYKTIFFIERALPAFHFRTFEGHGQTVVWREKTSRPLATPSVGLEAVGTMSYLDLIAHLDTMRVEADNEIYAAVARGVTVQVDRASAPAALV